MITATGPGGEELAMTPDDSMQRVYANALAVHAGPYDVALDFGQRIDEEEPEYSLRVAMSWEHAVSMVLVLQRLIAQYQDKLGSLPDIAKALEPVSEDQQ
jgi:hypothetical protein